MFPSFDKSISFQSFEFSSWDHESNLIQLKMDWLMNWTAILLNSRIIVLLI